MRRVLPIIVVSLLWSSSLTVAQIKTDREKAGLAGAVRTVRYEVAEFTSGGGKSVEGRRTPLQAVAYDAKGNIIEQVEYGHDGSVSQKLVYTYDAQGKSTGYAEYAGTLSAPRQHIYVLDGSGNKVEYRIVQPDGSAGEKYVYRYDVQGHKIEESLYDHKDKLIIRSVYAYDGRGRPVSQIGYNPDGSVSFKSHTAYNPEGRISERVRYEGDILTYRVRYTYNTRGGLAEQETVGSVVEPDNSRSEAHAPGRVLYVFKGREQPREAVVYNPDGSAREKVVFEYDSRGNWIKKSHLIQSAASGKGEPRRTEYRVITYF